VPRAAYLLALALLASVCLGSTADASQTTRLGVTFSPDRLGQGTNVEFNTRITAPKGEAPSPLSKLVMHYPSSLGFEVSGLGTETCPETILEARGPRGCPADSLMGRGSVVVAIPIGPEVIYEDATVAILRAPQEGGIAMFFYLEGIEPVYADVILTGFLAEGTAAAKSEKILVSVPLVEGLPHGPDVAVVQLRATFGPLGLTYYERIRGEFIPYRPRGILLPKRCPHGGFRFSADFTFQDASRSTALARVPCPARTKGGV
jgi:hypothetical protein